MVLATNVYSQKTNEERASKITNEISEVLSLNQEETAKVYKIQLKRFQEVVSIREKYKDDAETRKPELKKVYKRLFGKLKKTLGKAKMQQWAAYKREIGRE
jgi:pyruvate/2-oxoglutarate dehydrogenase complex dihydrolipoamide acyltransferase (E2) component